MKLSPGISALVVLTILALLGALIYSTALSRGGTSPISDFFSKKKDSTEDSEYYNNQTENSPPPVPPGLEDESENDQNYAKSWEDLPPGGQYTETLPMRYEGDDCGIWVQGDDDSWVKK